LRGQAQMTHARFESSDGWLLLSIIYAAGGTGADLRNVVSCGDYINHAIFTHSDVEEGINRLAGAGLIAVEGGVFVPKKKVLEPYKKYAVKKRAVFKELDFVENLLHSFSAPAARSLPKVTIPEAEFDSAVKEYISDFWQTGGKGKKRKRSSSLPGKR
jgi:hypothetical protein